MPVTCLTIEQAARLWALERSEAAKAMEHLERAGVLKQTAQGSYLLRSQ
jgi:DNA-binding IclR family transcriptional regulator